MFIHVCFPVGEDETVLLHIRSPFFFSEVCVEVGRTNSYSFPILERIRFGNHTNAFFFSDLFDIYEKSFDDTSIIGAHLVFQFWPMQCTISSIRIFVSATNKPKCSSACLWVQPYEGVWNLCYKGGCCKKQDQNNLLPKICLLISLTLVVLCPVACPLLYVLPRLLFLSKIFTAIIINVFFIYVIAYLFM